MSALAGHDVFISYSTTDKSIADAVCAALEGRGIRCWIAPRDVTPGLPFAAALVDAIDASRLFILVFSAAANGSPQVPREVARACNKGLAILTVRIEDAPMSKEMEYYLAPQHWLDAFPPPFEDYLDYLVESVCRLLEQVPALPPPVPPAVPRLFLSFAQEDAQYCEDLRWELLQAGVVVMSNDPRQASEYRTAERELEAIHECNCFVAVVSDTYDGSSSCRRHLDGLRHEFGGLGAQKRVFVVRIGRAPIPPFLQNTAWIGISGRSAVDDARRLLSALSGRVSVDGLREGVYWAGPRASAGGSSVGSAEPDLPDTPEAVEPERPSIDRLLAEGEGARVEFRAGVQRSEGIVRTVAKFMGADGGTLLLGVDPMGTVMGLERTYDALSMDRSGFANWLTERLEMAFGARAGRLQFSFEEIDGRDVCRIDVRPSLH